MSYGGGYGGSRGGGGGYGSGGYSNGYDQDSSRYGAGYAGSRDYNSSYSNGYDNLGLESTVSSCQRSPCSATSVSNPFHFCCLSTSLRQPLLMQTTVAQVGTQAAEATATQMAETTVHLSMDSPVAAHMEVAAMVEELEAIRCLILVPI